MPSLDAFLMLGEDAIGFFLFANLNSPFRIHVERVGLRPLLPGYGLGRGALFGLSCVP